MPNLLEVVRNPIAYIAARWTPTQRTLQRAASSALLMSVFIVLTGGAVRLTGSGLGCETWPKCSSESLTATSEMGIHGAIEFSNRMLTWVLSAAVGWTIIAVRSAKPARRGLSKLAWSQFWLVMSNGVVGGITVLTELNPYTVAGHFLAAMALLTVTALTWMRVREGDTPPRPLVGKPVKKLAAVLVVFSGLLVAAGTVVTGAGPHAGDSSEVPRMPIEVKLAAQTHGAFAWIVIVLTLALWFVLRAVDAPAGPRRATRTFLLVLLAQGVIGYVQYFTDMPEVLVALHLLGSTVVWVGALRVLMSMRERGLPQTAKATVPAPAVGQERSDVPDAAEKPVEPDAAEVPEAPDASPAHSR
ncbi:MULTISPECIES: COX15/CtaA family protein [unclassified Streptomyces]|uniref:COX15/CtaA family protein n=1 Tax=unclassified Streptomyces TaxID=2593676 RepID=UPI002DD9AB94|nr:MULTISPECIES: COX15/CtaA family protein [unclassified Streptomyces]WSA95613.1 COX15/CtaA family protein [Streptomyces sp. NBC_01795]WSB80031.1 COX15/CtaA family protein [Streptomyces sp. NBC_01775]WSS11762.1 COX15/CtaA family protein [Streptomyces sp. NBC_01186]WSS40474.1 COX15/CtaA family protein [Streptomyces sp. NBC_01187]